MIETGTVNVAVFMVINVPQDISLVEADATRRLRSEPKPAASLSKPAKNTK